MKIIIEINLINKYIDYLKNKNFSENTLRAYHLDLSRLLKWSLHNKGTVQDHIDSLSEEGLSPTTIRRAAAAIKQYYRWLFRNKMVSNPNLVIDLPRARRKIPQVLTRLEVDALISAAENLRDRTLIEFLYSTGARISEALFLKKSDIDESSQMVFLHGKGCVDRWVPISTKSLELISAYTANTNGEFVFADEKGRVPSRVTLYRKIQMLGREVGINKKIGCHTFRHSYATHLMEAGAHIMQIKTLLGHQRVSSTEVYLHCSRVNLFDAYKLHPRNS